MTKGIKEFFKSERVNNRTPDFMVKNIQVSSKMKTSTQRETSVVGLDTFVLIS